MPNGEIPTQVVVICDPMPYQLDHRGNKKYYYVFVVLLIHTRHNTNKAKIENKDSNNSYTEDQGRN